MSMVIVDGGLGSLDGFLDIFSSKESPSEEIAKLKHDLDLAQAAINKCDWETHKFYWNLAIQRWNKWISNGWTNPKSGDFLQIIDNAGKDMDARGVKMDAQFDKSCNQPAISTGGGSDTGTGSTTTATGNSEGCGYLDKLLGNCSKDDMKPLVTSGGGSTGGGGGFVVAPTVPGSASQTPSFKWPLTKRQTIGGGIALAGVTGLVIALIRSRKEK